MREVQGHSAQGRRAGHLREPAPQAAPGLTQGEDRRMARVAGVDLPRDKRGEVALTYIFGIGRSSARRILSRAGVDLNRRVREWTEDESARVREVIDREQRVEGDLRREVTMNIKRLMDIGSYRGVRHRKGLPLRGQRTHTNARTRKGPRRGVGIRKKATSKNPTTGKA